MRIAWVLAVIGAMAPPVEAGPYCGGDAATSPLDGQTLPVHPRILYAHTDTRYAGKPMTSRAEKTKATLDGKPVKLVIKDTKDGEWHLRFIEVASDKPGTLVIKVGDDEKATYTLDPAWKKPEKATLASMRRFSLDTHEERARKFKGIELKVDVPATSFVVRWRRDDKDQWRTFEIPAVKAEDSWLAPREKKTPPLPVAYIGQTRCGRDNIPFGLLTNGVELELVARLPDGSKLPIDGIPKPLMIPPEPPKRPAPPE